MKLIRDSFPYPTIFKWIQLSQDYLTIETIFEKFISFLILIVLMLMLHFVTNVDLKCRGRLSDKIYRKPQASI